MMIEHEQEQAQKIMTPTSEEEVSEILQSCSQDGRKVKISGGGTKLNLGNLYAETPVTVSTTQLDKLLDYQPEDLTITVGAGMTLARLQEILGEQGQMLALDPPDLSGQTVGGILATNRSGPRRLLYGTARDLLIGCRFVLADGSIGHSGGKVVKNVAGYDLHKLFIGAFGTLGILTEVTFKVVPRPQTVGVGLAEYKSGVGAFQAARQCARSNLMPAALEVVNLGGSDYSLYFGAEGVDVAVEGQMAGLREICLKAGASSAQILDDSAATWQKLTNLDIAPESGLRLKAGVTLTDLPRVTEYFQELQATFGLSGRIQAHAGTGVAYLSAGLNDSANYPQIARQIENIRAELRKLDGSLLIENGPSELKTLVDAWGFTTEELPPMLALRNKLDTQRLLNPGVMDF